MAYKCLIFNVRAKGFGVFSFSTETGFHFELQRLSFLLRLRLLLRLLLRLRLRGTMGHSRDRAGMQTVNSA